MKPTKKEITDSIKEGTMGAIMVQMGNEGTSVENGISAGVRDALLLRFDKQKDLSDNENWIFDAIKEGTKEAIIEIKKNGFD